MSEWRDEEANVRGIFREVNEQVRQVNETFGQDGYAESFLCECGNSACMQTIRVQTAEYEAVRVHPRRYLIARDHENPEIERIVHENGQFAVVETFVGEASRIAEETDPRVSLPG